MPFVRKLLLLFSYWGQRKGAIASFVLLNLFLCRGDDSTAAEKAVFRQPSLSETAISSQQCPSTLPALVERMLPDLPSYINRVRIRAGITKSYIVLAAKPEFEPLPLSGMTDLPSQPQSSNVKQVFFTTLMRRYEGQSITNLQEYHWAFFAGQQQDWQLAMMYSTIGVYPATASQPPLAPRNSSDSSVAVAIKAWLVDCRDGNLMPLLKLKSISPKKASSSQIDRA
jgi:hypothetical protein